MDMRSLKVVIETYVFATFLRWSRYDGEKVYMLHDYIMDDGRVHREPGYGYPRVTREISEAELLLKNRRYRGYAILAIPANYIREHSKDIYQMGMPEAIIRYPLLASYDKDKVIPTVNFNPSRLSYHIEYKKEGEEGYFRHTNSDGSIMQFPSIGDALHKIYSMVEKHRSLGDHVWYVERSDNRIPVRE